jgi:general stress protein 26
MTRQELLAMMRANRFAIQASVSSTGSPQAAVVGIIVTDDFEVFFDTLATTRKMRNLRQNRKIAFAIGGTVEGDERTVQCEGIADEPTGSELERLKSIYFDRFPDGPGRLSWPGLVYVRARPSWIRYSDFKVDPPLIIELDRDQMAALE